MLTKFLIGTTDKIINNYQCGVAIEFTAPLLFFQNSVVTSYYERKRTTALEGSSDEPKI